MNNDVQRFVASLLRPTGPATDIEFIPHPEPLPVGHQFPLDGHIWCVSSWQQRTAAGYKICVVRLPVR